MKEWWCLRYRVPLACHSLGMSPRDARGGTDQETGHPAPQASSWTYEGTRGIEWGGEDGDAAEGRELMRSQAAGFFGLRHVADGTRPVLVPT